MKEKRKIVEVFDYVADAQILKLKLEAEGIAVYLRDEAILANDPLISEAIGGVKLEVFEKDWERAKAIWSDLKDYARDEEGRLLQCSNCGACRYEVVYQRKNWFYRLFPFFEVPVYECQQCKFLSRNPSPKSEE